MIRFTIWVALLLGLVPATIFAAEQGQRERTFVRALELFDSAKSADDYRESARTFETILDGGFQNGAVYYNSGNAWFRAGEYGRAILSYRKAKPFRPRDPYLTANLDQALATAPGRLTAAPVPWWSHVLFWSDWYSYPQKLRAFFIGWALLAVATTVGVTLRLSRMKLPIAGGVLLLLIFGVDCWLSDQQVNHSLRAVITRETIARKGIGDKYEPAFDQPLRDGAEFEVITVTPDWTFGHFGSIGDGWVRNEFVAR